MKAINNDTYASVMKELEYTLLDLSSHLSVCEYDRETVTNCIAYVASVRDELKVATDISE